MKSRLLRFSVLLPVLEILVWIWLVPVRSEIIAHRIARSSSGSTITVRSGGLEFSLQRDQLPRIAFQFALRDEAQIITSLNLPAMWGQWLSFPFTRHLAWSPSGFTLIAWRCLTYPFLAIPAWWFIGRVIDQLRRGAKIRMLVEVLSGVVSLLFLVALCSILLAPRSDRSGMLWLAPGLAFWSAAFAIAPAAMLTKRSRRLYASR